MIQALKKPISWLQILAFVFGGWLVATTVLGFNNPTAAPVGGFSALTADPAGNVGVGITVPTVRLDVNGDIKTNGGITLGGVRRTTWPSGGGGIGGSGTANTMPIFTDSTTLGDSPLSIIAGGFLSSTHVINAPRVNATSFNATGAIDGNTIRASNTMCLRGACISAWPGGGGGGVTGSGTGGRITKWLTSSSVGNSSIVESGSTVTFTGDIVANANSWGSQTSATGPTGYNTASHWGGSSSGNGLNWTLQCPSGYYMIGIRQTQTSNKGRPGIICARL